MRTEINYVIGDATEPQFAEGETAIIVHICNDIGAWGAGFTRALSKKWKGPEKKYRRSFVTGDINNGYTTLGCGLFVQVAKKILVYNLIGQHDIGLDHNDIPPIRYPAVRDGLQYLSDWHDPGDTYHMPRIGCGLAGGTWDVMEKIIQEELCDKGYRVTVYDLPK